MAAYIRTAYEAMHMHVKLHSAVIMWYMWGCHVCFVITPSLYPLAFIERLLYLHSRLNT